MKKILFVAVAGLLMAACNNVAQFKAPIEALTTQWDSTTTVVTNFATLLTQEVQNAQSMATGLPVSEDAMKKLDDATKTRLAELEKAFQQESQGLSSIKSELDGFVQSWGEKTQLLNGLKEGLASKKLGKETATTISDLQAAVTEAGSKVGAWTEQLNATKAKLEEIAMQHAKAMGGGSSSLIGG